MKCTRRYAPEVQAAMPAGQSETEVCTLRNPAFVHDPASEIVGLYRREASDRRGTPCALSPRNCLSCGSRMRSRSNWATASIPLSSRCAIGESSPVKVRFSFTNRTCTPRSTRSSTSSLIVEVPLQGFYLLPDSQDNLQAGITYKHIQEGKQSTVGVHNINHSQHPNYRTRSMTRIGL